MPANGDLREAFDAFQRGDLERARGIAEQQLAIAPDSPILAHLMGLILCRSGQFETGIAWLTRAWQSAPRELQFQLMLARALIDGGRPEEALRVTQAAAGPAASDLRLLNARAEAAHACGRFDVAADALRRIAEANPDDPIAWMNLGRALLPQNALSDAELAYRKALAIAPGDVAAIRELGLALERTNQRDALAALIDDARQGGVGEQLVPELWALRDLWRGGAREALQRLRNPRPAGADPVLWDRLRAKAADSVGEAAEAFAATEAMNRQSPDYSAWRERGAAYRRDLRVLAATITRDWADAVPQLEPATDQRIGFLVGFPRSGTTLADTFLMGHPDCDVIEELPLLFDAASGLGPPQWLNRCSRAQLEGARQAYFDGLRTLAGLDARRIIDKFPLNLVVGGLIQRLFPGAPVIFVQRHPCDAVLSGFMQSFAPNLGMASFLDLADAADFYDCVMSVWFSSRDAFALPACTIVYEELVRDPEAALRPAVEFLGLDWDDRMLDHLATAQRRGAIPNTSYDQVTQPLTTAASGRWKRYEKQLEPVLPVLLPWADRLGY